MIRQLLDLRIAKYRGLLVSRKLIIAFDEGQCILIESIQQQAMPFRQVGLAFDSIPFTS